MKKLLTLGLAAGVLAIAGAANAFPTFFGPTGGLDVPTAEVQQGYGLTVDMFSNEFTNIPRTYLLAGIMPGLELGALVTDQGAGFDTLWSFNGKYVLPINIPGNGKVALGTIYSDFGDEMGVNFNRWDIYLSGTFDAFADTKFTGNVTYSKFNPGNSTDYSYGLGLEKCFDGGVALGAEYVINPQDFDGSDFNDYANLYLRKPINDNLTARVAITQIGTGSDNSLLEFGAEYVFGCK